MIYQNIPKDNENENQNGNDINSFRRIQGISLPGKCITNRRLAYTGLALVVIIIIVQLVIMFTSKSHTDIPAASEYEAMYQSQIHPSDIQTYLEKISSEIHLAGTEANYETVKKHKSKLKI